MESQTTWQVHGYLKSNGQFYFLPGPFALTMNDHIWSFNSQPTNFVSMAAKSSNLVEEMSEANLQTEGHMDVLTQSAKILWELEVLDSPPSHSPSWSLAQRLPSSCPNIKYCLEICVTLMEEMGAIHPPSHSWTAPLVEDMLCNARTGLTNSIQWPPGTTKLGKLMDSHNSAAVPTVKPDLESSSLLGGCWSMEPTQGCQKCDISLGDGTGTLDGQVGSHTRLVIYPTFTICYQRVVFCALLNTRFKEM